MAAVTVSPYIMEDGLRNGQMLDTRTALWLKTKRMVAITYVQPCATHSVIHFCPNTIPLPFATVHSAGVRRCLHSVSPRLAQISQDSSRHVPRLTYDFMFFVIVVIILLNIVFGIILDTFAQLRSERERIQNDMVTRCFICGLQATMLDRYTQGGFAAHIKETHNVWNYFFFTYHLEQKPEDDYTGQVWACGCGCAGVLYTFMPRASSKGEGGLVFRPDRPATVIVHRPFVSKPRLSKPEYCPSLSTDCFLELAPFAGMQ